MTIRDTSAIRRRAARQALSEPLPSWWILKVVVGGVVCAAVGLSFVFVKVKQHALGESIRQLEARVAEVKACNQALRSELSTLTSHASLRQALAAGRIAMVPVSDQYVARLTPASAPEGVPAQGVASLPGRGMP